MASNYWLEVENLSVLFAKQANLNQSSKSRDGNSQSINNDSSSLNIPTLARYFGLQCDEFLRRCVNAPSTSDNSSCTDRQIESHDNLLESRIKKYYASSLLTNINDEHEFLSYLRRAGQNLHRTRIGCNIRFQWTYDNRFISNYQPNFLVIRYKSTDERHLDITVAEIGSGLTMCIEDCIRVTLYAMDLNIWLKRHQLDQQISISKIGEVWLSNDSATFPYKTRAFPIDRMRKRLDHFFKNNFESILKGSEWMMLPRCANCKFVSTCRQHIIEHERSSINNLAYLAPVDHTFIRSIFSTAINKDLVLNKLTDNSLNADDIVKLQKSLSINLSNRSIAALDAIETRTAQVKPHKSLYIAKENQQLVLLLILLLPDRSRMYSVALLAYNIYDVSRKAWFSSVPCVELRPSVSKVASVIAQSLATIRTVFDRPCQIVVFDEHEQTILFDQLILASDTENIIECLPLLSASDFATLTLDNAQSEIIDDENSQSAPENIEQIQEEPADVLLGLPYFISLHTAVRQSFVVPVPGYFDLQDLKRLFGISLPSSDPKTLNELLSSQDIGKLVQEHFAVIALLYASVQTRLSQSECLLFDARPLPPANSSNSSHASIRRLIFSRQCEMLFSLRSIRQSRFDVYEPPIVLRIIRGPLDKYKGEWECQIERGEEIVLRNSAEKAMGANDFRTFPYLISESVDSVRLFSDAVYMSAVVEWLRNKPKLKQMGFAQVDRFDDKEDLYLLRVKHCDFPIQVNQSYFLSERYVDFNTKKTIQALEDAAPLVVTLLDDPRCLQQPRAISQVNNALKEKVSNMFIQQDSPVKSSRLNLLNSAQQQACERVKNERLLLIWGPPGTGKTYWSAIAIMQLLVLATKPLRVLVSACTHTAIDNLLASIEEVKTVLSSSPQFLEYHDVASKLLIKKLDSKNRGRLSTRSNQNPIVVGSTVWMLSKVNPSYMFDVIVIDEATQVLTADAVLALNHLADDQESHLIIVGDPLQLPPIKRYDYPTLPNDTPDLFSSLFHCFLRDENNRPISLNAERPFEQIMRCPYVSAFNENHRMNEQLSDFTRFLYGEHFCPGRPIPPLCIRPTNTLSHELLGPALRSSASLYTILVDLPVLSSNLAQDINLESRLVISVITELVNRASLSSIFVIAPHRMQRVAIRQQLARASFRNLTIKCDTVERMQGQEAQCSLLCMLYRQRESVDAESDFIYDRQRLNVSLTRAKQLSIILMSRLVLDQPPLGVFVNNSTRNAFVLLNKYVEKSIVRELDCNGNVK